MNGQSVRDAAPALLDFRFADATLPVLPRKVITTASCNACHVDVQAHGGSRRNGEGCSVCHTQGAVDRTVGSVGIACTANAQCQSWESCQDTNKDGKPDSCVIVQDPTPNRSIRFASLIHSLHFGRLLDGYSERNDLITPGKLVYIGFQNGVSDFSEVLLPLDVRNCGKCHGDQGGTCSAAAPCGIGQLCVAGTCQNNAYTTPSAEICLSCHDADDSNGHVALNTWKDTDGNTIETCGVCHGPDAEFAVAKVHNISSPYRPPYQRTKGQ